MGEWNPVAAGPRITVTRPDDCGCAHSHLRRAWKTAILCMDKDMESASSKPWSGLLPAMHRWAFVGVTFAAFALSAADSRADKSGKPAYSVSLSGNYLAGRYAGKRRENEAAAGFYARALTEDPDNAYILERSFLLEISAGNLSRAARLAVRVLERDSRHRIAHVILGLKHFRAGRRDRARAHFRSSAHGPIGELTAALLIAWSHQADGRTAKAIEALDILENTDSFQVFRNFHSAMIHDLAGNERQARDLYRSSYEEASTSLRVVQAYGAFLERHGRSARARAIYRTFLESSPGHPLILEAMRRAGSGGEAPRLVSKPGEGAGEALFGIASALTDESSIDVALLYVRLTLYTNRRMAIAQTLLGDIYEDTKRHERAVDAYGEVPSSSPLRVNAEIQIASNLENLDRPDEARKRLERLMTQYPESRRPVLVLANILRGRRSFAEAAEFYTKAIELTPNPVRRDWTLFYFRGICFERIKVWPKAEVDFKQALELFPDQPLVLNYLGYSWIEKGIHLHDAMKKIRKAVELRKNDGYIVDSLGWAYYQMGDYEEAVKHLERAVELRPEDPVINDHLGDAYWQVGRRLEAKFQWEHAKGLEPEPEDLQEILEKLRNGLEPPDGGKATSSSQTPNKS